MNDPREVPVTLHTPPNDMGTLSGSGTITDTPENRERLEAAAIPGCRRWREANPETPHMPPAVKDFDWWKANSTPVPAPYCCSAYCDRCTGLRALDGALPLPPNDWMDPVS